MAGMRTSKVAHGSAGAERLSAFSDAVVAVIITLMAP